MQRIINKIEAFLLSNTVWIFCSIILGLSIILVFQQKEHTWMVYLNNVIRFGLVFSPVLLFIGFRDWLKKHLPLLLFSLLWAMAFLAYPKLVEVLNWHEIIADGDLGKAMSRATGTGFLAVELIILANDYWNKKATYFKWIQKLSLEKGIMIFTALFSILYAFTGFVILDEVPASVSFWYKVGITFQIFLICLVYYGFYYINHYFLIARIWKKKGVVYYGFAFLAAVILLYPLAGQLILFLPMVKQTEIHPLNNGEIFDEINFLIPFSGMLASVPFILALEWFKQRNEIISLEQEKSATELNLLKQQINPHFFFNTLNNLYALSIKKDEATPEVILQLSELMRYVIYKGKEEWVSLEEEVKYIEDYIRLQQIRLHKHLDFRFEKQIEDPKFQVPPLLFILLIENAFKHGIEPAEEDCFLYISLSGREDQLEFTCENSVEEREDETNGIGLSNLRRRLELRFPNQHHFEIQEEAHRFKAILKLTFK